MKSDQAQIKQEGGTRQKITAGIITVVVFIIIWQVYGLFANKGAEVSHPTTSPKGMPSTKNALPPANIQTPQPAALPTASSEVFTQEDADRLAIQRQMEGQYISAVNQLQMLKLERDIAEMNKAIMSAKFDTVSAQKHIVDLLTPPAPPATPATYAKGLVQQQGASFATSSESLTPATQEVNYTVISVTRLQNKWAAVIGYKGNLISVSVGDVLPPDGSLVIAIGKAGILLEKNGVKKKVSLVPII